MQQLKKKLQRAADRFMASKFAQKGVLALVCLTVSVGEAMAASKGAAGFTKATQEVSSYQTPVSNLMKAIAAVIVLVGAFNVYFKMQNGDQDVKKTIMLTSADVSRSSRCQKPCPCSSSNNRKHLHDDESGGLSRFQGLAKAAGVHGHPWPLPHTGGSGGRRVVRRLYRVLHYFGKTRRVHRHAGDGCSWIGCHLCQAAWRPAQQAAFQRHIHLQAPDA